MMKPTEGEGMPERLMGGHTGRMLVSLSFGWLAVSLGRQALPPLLPNIIDDLAISPFQAGVGLTLLWAIYALFHYPGGRLGDELSRKTILVAGLGVLIAGFTLLTMASTYPLFLIAVSVVGIGTGLYFVPMRAHISSLFVERRGQAFGVNGAFGHTGSGLGGVIAIAVVSVATWRGAFLPVIVGLGAVAVLIHRWSREPYVVSGVDFELRDTVARVFRSPRVARLVVAYSLYAFANQAIMGFLPTFLQVDRGFSPALASATFASLFAVGIVVGPLSGGLGDRLHHFTVAAGSLGLALLGLVGMLVMSTAPLIVGSVFVFAVGMRAFSPVMQAYVMGLFPDANVGGDFGAFKTVYILVGSVGPTYVGFVAERATYTFAFTGLGACLVLATFILGWIAVQQEGVQYEMS